MPTPKFGVSRPLSPTSHPVSSGTHSADNKESLGKSLSAKNAARILSLEDAHDLAVASRERVMQQVADVKASMLGIQLQWAVYYAKQAKAYIPGLGELNTCLSLINGTDEQTRRAQVDAVTELLTSKLNNLLAERANLDGIIRDLDLAKTEINDKLTLK